MFTLNVTWNGEPYRGYAPEAEKYPPKPRSLATTV